MKPFFTAVITIGLFEIIYGTLGILLNTPPTNEGMILGGIMNILIALLLIFIYKMCVEEQEKETNE